VDWEIWVTLISVTIMVIALARNVAGPEVLLLAELILLVSLGIVSPGEAVAGFGNEALITVAVLFVIVAGLTETGGMSALVEPVLGRPKSLGEANVRMVLPVSFISSFLNNTPVVAMFVPIINDWCRKLGFAPSKLFIPLSYAAVLGGVCTLIGTSTNLVVNGLLIDAGLEPMGMFTITRVGLPVAVVGITYLLLTAPRLLPDRRAPIADITDARQYTVEMLVQPGSAIENGTIEAAGLRHLPGLYLAEIERDGRSLVAVGPEEILKGNDRLIFAGLIDSVVDLQKIRGLVPATNHVFELATPRADRNLIEAVVSSTCPLVGKSIRDGRFRSVYDAAVIAVHRQGERILQKIGDIVLRPGDTLLIEAHPRFLQTHRNAHDFLLVSAVAGSQPPRHDRAWVSVGIMAALVIAVGMEWIGMLQGGLIAGALMILTRCCSVGQARASLDGTVILSIGAALGIGRALDSSGTADVVAEQFLALVRPFGPVGLLVGVYFATLMFTEILTNNAAAALLFPIARAAAAGMGVEFMPYAIAIAVAASCGFASPIGYATHLMVYGAGGYRFGDFFRYGIVMDILIGATAIAATAWWWGLV
jgi:di/tricarboxylate transporter